MLRNPYSSKSLEDAQGAGGTPTTVIRFAPSDARFIRITQTGSAASGEQWAIAQVRVYQATR